MIKNDVELIIGARGWNFDHWHNSFYPDGLPEDWRFSYYSNEFRSVLIPWEELQGVSPEKSQQWLNDTDEGFVFFVEIALHASWEHWLPIIEPLAPQLGAVVLRDAFPQKTASLDLGVVDTLVRNIREQAPIIVDGNALTARLELLLAEYQPGCYWRPDEAEVTQCNADIALAEITSVTQHHPRSLKKIIEDCCSVQGPTTIGFFIGGKAPNISDLRNAIMIWQLLK